MNYLDYIVIAIYIIAFLFLGYSFKGSKTSKDYFLGGKSFGWLPLSLSTAATQISAISFISAPAFVGLKEGGGMKWLTFEFAVPLAMIFIGIFIVPTMYQAGVVSVYEFLEKRFGPSTRILMSSVFQISRAFATSVMIYAVALILSNVVDVPMWQTILTIGIVTIIYSFQGGMKAVVYGDAIQLILLIIGIFICLFVALYNVGGWDIFINNVEESRLKSVDFTSMGTNKNEEFGFWPMLLGGFFLYASYYGTDQSQVQRLLSAQDLKTVNKTILVNGLLRFPITLIYCIMGLIIGTLVSMNPAFRELIPMDKPDLMMPIFITQYLPHGIIGMLIVAILSAAMSSLSSTVNSLSAATVEDFFNRDKGLDDKTYSRYSRLAVIFWGGITLVLAFYTGEIAPTVIEAINKIGSVFYGPMIAAFIAAINLPRIQTKGINIGIIFGVGVNVCLWIFMPHIFWFWWNFVGAVVTLVIAVIVSAISDKSQPHYEIHKDMTIHYEKKNALILIAFFIFIIIISTFMPFLLK